MPRVDHLCVIVPADVARSIRSGSPLEREFSLAAMGRMALEALERVEPAEEPVSEEALSRVGVPLR